MNGEKEGESSPPPPPPAPNTTASPEEVKQVMDDVVWPAIECAKIVITEFEPWVPPSLLSISQSPPPPPAPAPPPSSDPSSDPTTPEGPPPPAIPSVQTFQETVTEWLLLSSCNSFVVSTSAFGRTAAMYSMHPMSIYTPQSCEPQTPVRVSSFGEGSKRQF
ncbi:unnamed protein product [Closterium sp. NIES-54]